MAKKHKQIPPNPQSFWNGHFLTQARRRCLIWGRLVTPMSSPGESSLLRKTSWEKGPAWTYPDADFFAQGQTQSRGSSQVPTSPMKPQLFPQMI